MVLFVAVEWIQMPNIHLGVLLKIMAHASNEIPPKWIKIFCQENHLSVDRPAIYLSWALFPWGKKKDNLILTQKGASSNSFSTPSAIFLRRLLFWCVCFGMFLPNSPVTDFLRSCSTRSCCNSGSIWSCGQSSRVSRVTAAFQTGRMLAPFGDLPVP